MAIFLFIRVVVPVCAMVTNEPRGDRQCIRTDEGAGMALCLKLCLADSGHSGECFGRQVSVNQLGEATRQRWRGTVVVEVSDVRQGKPA